MYLTEHVNYFKMYRSCHFDHTILFLFKIHWLDLSIANKRKMCRSVSLQHTFFLLLTKVKKKNSSIIFKYCMIYLHKIM